MRSICVLAVALSIAGPAMAINKCTGPGGRVVFQDAPCQDGGGEKLVVRPASGHAPVQGAAQAAPSVAPGAAQPTSELARLTALADRYKAQNRISSLNARVIPDARGRIHSQKVRCDAEFAALRERKGLANNNLAGATWEQSISSEMSAVATRCDTEGRVLSGELDGFLKELSDLQASLK